MPIRPVAPAPIAPRIWRSVAMLVALGTLMVAYCTLYLWVREVHLLVHTDACLGGHIADHDVQSGGVGPGTAPSLPILALYFAAPYVFYPLMLVERAYWKIALPASAPCP